MFLYNPHLFQFLGNFLIVGTFHAISNFTECHHFKNREFLVLWKTVLYTLHIHGKGLIFYSGQQNGNNLEVITFCVIRIWLAF